MRGGSQGRERAPPAPRNRHPCRFPRRLSESVYIRRDGAGERQRGRGGEDGGSPASRLAIPAPGPRGGGGQCSGPAGGLNSAGPSHALSPPPRRLRSNAGYLGITSRCCCPRIQGIIAEHMRGGLGRGHRTVFGDVPHRSPRSSSLIPLAATRKAPPILRRRSGHAASVSDGR